MGTSSYMPNVRLERLPDKLEAQIPEQLRLIRSFYFQLEKKKKFTKGAADE